MKTIAIIPARGGSKRIPKKNIKFFYGKPIISYSIEVAKKSNLFDEIMVSTDDIEISKVSKSYGAEVPFIRSKLNSKDDSTTADVISEVIQKYKSKGRTFDYICCIYPTAPLLNEKHLIKSFNIFMKNKFESLIPLVSYSTPIQRAIKLNDKKIEMFFPEFTNSRSQDLERAYFDSGQFYWIDNQSFIKKNKLFTDNTGGYILSELQAQDIDNPDDWELTKLKYKLNERLFD